MSVWTDAVAATSPYLWWKLDETSGTTVLDSSGAGRNGVYTSTADMTRGQSSLVPGDPTGVSLTLNANAAQVSVGSGLSYPTTGVTFATTYKSATLKTGRLFQATTFEPYLAFGSTDVTAFLSISSAPSFAWNPAPLFDGAPHLIVWTIRAASTELWVDGVRVGTAAHTVASTTATMFLLKQNSGGLSGSFDDVLVWNTDLSSSQIGALTTGWSGSGPATPSLSIAGALPALVGDFQASLAAAPASMSLAASLPALDGSLSLSAPDAPLDLSLAGVLPALVGDFATSAASTSTTDAANRVGGRTRSGYGIAEWSPAVVPTPPTLATGHKMLPARAYGPVTMRGTQPIFTASKAEIPRDRQRIIVGGVDVTYFRDVATPDVDYQLADPLMWGPGRLELPQVAAAHERPGRGPLKWLRKGAPVVVQRVNAAGEVTAIDYRGVVIAFDVAGANLSVELGGHGQGRAALVNRQVQIFRSVRDVGRYAWRSVKALGLPFEPRLGPETGVEISKLSGGTTQLEYIRELCHLAQVRSGKRWTIMPNDSGVYRMREKDVTTIHATAFTDDAHTVANLRRDAAEEPNRIFASGVTPEGKRIRFAAYPGLKQGDAPDYPYGDGRTFGEGTTNEETGSGDGIAVLTARLRHTGYLSLDVSPGGYDADVTRALRAFQDEAGLPKTGDVDPATWRGLFDLDATGYSLAYSQITPAAQTSATRMWRRSGSGAIIGRNENYDRKVLKVDRNIDMGSAGFWRGEIREFAGTELHDGGESNWTGTIDLNTGAVLRGEVPEGATVTAGDVMDARDLRPGMNLWLPQFDGGTRVYISGIDHKGGSTTLYVDTRNRDALEVWEVITRNRETRASLSRAWLGHRSSTEAKDSIDVWDDVAGFCYNDVALHAGWNLIEIVGGQAGTVSSIRLALEDSAEFACAVFGRNVREARLDHLIPNPLTQAGTEAWEKRAVRNALEDRGLLYSAGTNDEPCGYSPGSKSGTAPLRGVHEDDAGFSYETPPGRPFLYLAVYVRSANTLKRGRVMWAQLEAGA